MLLKVNPFEQLGPSNCGPAALRAILSYFHIRKNEKELAVFCKTTIKDGTHPWDLVRVAKQLDFRVKSGEFGSWKLLNFYVNKKKLPVLIDWFKIDDGHYSVVCGLTKNFIWIADPGEGKIVRMPWRTFRRIWFDFEKDFLKKKKDVNLRWWMVLIK